LLCSPLPTTAASSPHRVPEDVIGLHRGLKTLPVIGPMLSRNQGVITLNERVANQVVCVWRKWLSRRDHRGVVTWTRFNELLARHPLPPVKILHGYTPRGNLSREEPDVGNLHVTGPGSRSWFHPFPDGAHPVTSLGGANSRGSWDLDAHPLGMVDR
jgi:hypothetical protein